MAEETQPAPSTSTDSKDVEENKGMAAISYIWILFLIPYLTKKDSPFAMYHAKQGLVFFIFSIIVGFLWWIPFVGWALGLFSLVLFIMGIVNALGGKKAPLPLIGQFAEKF